MTMRAGRLDRRLVLKRRQLATPNAHGEQVATYTDYATVWAEMLPGAGNEQFIAQTTYASTDARFRIRYRSDVSVTDRVECEGVEYDVIGIAEIGRRKGLEIFAAGAV